MKLNETELAVGRRLVEQGDLEAFEKWHAHHFPRWGLESEGVEGFREMIRLGATKPALRVFDKVYPNADPIHDTVAAVLARVVLGLIVLSVVGAICSIVLLVRSCVG